MTARRDLVLMVMLGAGALALRLPGLHYGLPAVYNPDEVAIMTRALSFGKGTLNPENFLYPTFYFYVLFGWVGTYLGFTWLTGGVGSVTELQQLYFRDPTGIYTAGRALTALCGALSVVVLFRLTDRLFNRRVAIAAAVLLAVAPLAVRDAHYVKHDVPATLAILLAYLAMVRIWPGVPAAGGQRHQSLIAGAASGVAFSTHYYCVFLAIPLALVLFLRWRDQGWRVAARQFVTAGLAATVVFFTLSPFLLVEPVTAWRDITANRQIVLDRAVQAGVFAPAQRYLEILWSDSIGRAPVLFGLAGLLWMAVIAPVRALVLIAFALPFLAFISNTAPASRYLNPVLPFVAVFASFGLWQLTERMRASGVLFWLGLVALAAGPLIDSMRSNRFFSIPDTRSLALELVEQTIPSGSTVLIQPYSVPLTPSRQSLEEALTRNLGSVEAASAKFRLQLSLSPYPEPAYRLLWLGRGGLDAEKIYVDPAELDRPDGFATLERLGVTYVILKRYNRLEPELASFVAELSRRGRLIARFSPYWPAASAAELERVEPFLHNTDTRIDAALERPGPPLEIWQIDAPDS